MPKKATGALPPAIIADLTGQPRQRYQKAKEGHGPQDLQSIATGLTKPQVKFLAGEMKIYRTEREVAAWLNNS